MKRSIILLSCIFTLAGILIFLTALRGQTKLPFKYHIYAGNTHAHTIFTMSHGAQYNRIPNHKHHMYVDSEGVSHTRNTKLKSDWYKYQGLPSVHYALAKTNGYDFYVTTDHSQEAGFHPTSPISAAWLATNEEATEATDKNFVAIRGYEHSENNGPGGKGHINVINSATYLNALEPGIDLQYLYKWLDTVASNGSGPVVASFNHPGAHQYNNWAYRDPKVTNIITMLEVINSNWRIHYAGFINALDAGWKVSPVSGLDNHNLWGITHDKSRTFVLAKSKTKKGILEAMKNRRTYASLDINIQCWYTVNGKIMGSTFNQPVTFKFDIHVSDPDINNPKDKITKIDIVKDNGVVVKSYTPDPAYAVHWSPIVKDSGNKYFFIRIWDVSGGDDSSHANPEKPMAWLAPVWTGR